MHVLLCASEVEIQGKDACVTQVPQAHSYHKHISTTSTLIPVTLYCSDFTDLDDSTATLATLI